MTRFQHLWDARARAAEWLRHYNEDRPHSSLGYYERASTLVTSNLPFNEWTEAFGSERLTGALLDLLTRHVHILEMNGESFRLQYSKRHRASKSHS